MSEFDPAALTASDLQNPALSAEQLAQIAAARPDLWEAILAHPNCYAGLSDWIRSNSVPAPTDTGSTQSPEPDASHQVTADTTGLGPEPVQDTQQEPVAQPYTPSAPQPAPQAYSPQEPAAQPYNPQQAQGAPQEPVGQPYTPPQQQQPPVQAYAPQQPAAQPYSPQPPASGYPQQAPAQGYPSQARPAGAAAPVSLQGAISGFKGDNAGHPSWVFAAQIAIPAAAFIGAVSLFLTRVKVSLDFSDTFGDFSSLLSGRTTSVSTNFFGGGSAAGIFLILLFLAVIALAAVTILMRLPWARLATFATAGVAGLVGVIVSLTTFSDVRKANQYLDLSSAGIGVYILVIASVALIGAAAASFFGTRAQDAKTSAPLPPAPSGPAPYNPHQ